MGENIQDKRQEKQENRLRGKGKKEQKDRLQDKQQKEQENRLRDKQQKEQWKTDLQNKEQQNDSVSGSMAVLHTLQVTEGMEGLDQSSKELYRHKEVLAIILKGVVREYESYSYSEIMDFIEADSITGSEFVSPGHSDIDNRIVGR